MGGKRTVYASLDPVTYQALLEAATRAGARKLTEFAAELIAQALENNLSVPDALRRALQLKRRQEERDSVRTVLRAEYARMKKLRDEDGLRDVLAIADELGIPEDEITGTMFAISNKDTEPAKAERWLLGLLASHGTLPERAVREAAANEGIADWAVTVAKRKLGVRSERQGRQWVWVLAQTSPTQAKD